MESLANAETKSIVTPIQATTPSFKIEDLVTTLKRPAEKKRSAEDLPNFSKKKMKKGLDQAFGSEQAIKRQLILVSIIRSRKRKLRLPMC